MKTYKVKITGTMPLLLHSDNIEWADRMDEWRKNSKNKQKSKAGDDRTPPWRWIGCLYHDKSILTIPCENIMRCIMEGAKDVPTGKGKKTFKAQSQSGIHSGSYQWPLLVAGKTIAMKGINALLDEDLSFAQQIKAVSNLGFSLFMKRARVGQAKHIRVRPRFDEWATIGELVVTDVQITKEILEDILDIGGRLKGLGDWRPGSPTPGPFGMFTAEVE